MKKIVIGIVAVIILVCLFVIGFFYFTRPISQTSATDSASMTAATELAIPTNASSTLYRISQSGSEAQFNIQETLHGSPASPTGTTSQITGDFVINNQPGSTSITAGTISIDATTLHTDSAQRDGAIGRFILKSDLPANQFITFTPTSVNGLPATLPENTPFSFTVSGNFTISGVTKPATLNVTATLTPDSFSGTASTTVNRSDYGLTIPNIPFVANVSDAVQIQASFVANAVQQ